MATNTKTSVPPSSTDLEETAELPQLSATGVVLADPLSSTDAWLAPSPSIDTSNTQDLPTLSTHKRSRESNVRESNPIEAEIGALRSDLASVSESRSKLERDIDSLSGNLRELEQLLNRKIEELSVYEREVGLRDRRIAELEARAHQLGNDLVARQQQFDSELGQRQTHFDSQLAAVEAQRLALDEQLTKARAEGETLRAQNKSQASDLQSLKSERAALTQRVQAAETDLVQWRERGERYRETLQSLEGRRQLYDSAVAEREARIAALEHEGTLGRRAADARAEELQAAVRVQEARVRELDAARTRAEAANTSARQRIAALEAETRAQEQSLRELRAQSQQREQSLSADVGAQQQRNTELERARNETAAAAAAARDRIVALEAEIETQERQLRELRAQGQAHEQSLTADLAGQKQRNAELEKARSESAAAAATARDRIVALEADMRLQELNLRELRTQSEAREQALNKELSTQQRRNTEIEAARNEAAAAASAAREQAAAAAAEARARIEALESETRQRAESLAALQAKSQATEAELTTSLQTQQLRSAELEHARDELGAAAAAARRQAEADAAAAAERIATLEAETAKQAESLQELRVQFGAVRDSLAQRNALIERVEAEAASSVAMLGNIQQNLEQLGADDQAHLLTRSDGTTGIVHLLGKRTTFGRTPDNDVRVDAEFISRHHAVALRTGGKTVIEDLNSTNGTYVNGQRVSRRTLKDGDLVMLGKTEFRFNVSKVPA